MRSAEFTLGSYACSSSTCASRPLVLAVCAEPEFVEAVLPCTHVSNATEQQASSLGEKLNADLGSGSPPSSQIAAS